MKSESGIYYKTRNRPLYVLQSNGMVTAWGEGGDPVVTNLPASLSNIVAIAAGEEHALALTAGGNVTAWGGNTYGQCNVPTNLLSGKVMAIAAGATHSVALKNDGTVVVWGDNSDEKPTCHPCQIP